MNNSRVFPTIIESVLNPVYCIMPMLIPYYTICKQLETNPTSKMIEDNIAVIIDNL